MGGGAEQQDARLLLFLSRSRTGACRCRLAGRRLPHANRSRASALLDFQRPIEHHKKSQKALTTTATSQIWWRCRLRSGAYAPSHWRTETLWQPLAGPLTLRPLDGTRASDRQVGYIPIFGLSPRPGDRGAESVCGLTFTLVHPCIEVWIFWPHHPLSLAHYRAQAFLLQLSLFFRFGSPTSMSHRYRLPDVSMTAVQSIPRPFSDFCVKTAWLSRRHLTLQYLSSSFRLYPPQFSI